MEMSPIDWAMRPIKRYATFSGRAPRAEFWWFTLFVTVIYLVLGFAVGFSAASFMTMASTGAGFASLGVMALVIVLFWLAILLPMIAVQVRRLHDTNRSGWWLGAYYLVYLAYIVMMFGAAAAGAKGTESSSGSIALAGIVGIVFMVYSVVLLVFFCLRGTQGPNRFGPDPYGVDVVEATA